MEPSKASEITPRDSNPTPTAQQESGFKEAVRLCAFMWVGFVVMGAGLGVLVTSYGLPWWVAPALSGLVFAGSLEFLLVGMIATMAPLGLIASTTLLINARHLVYGISYPLHRVNGKISKAIAIYMLCDEAYALNTGPEAKNLRSSRIMTVTIGMWFFWVAGSLCGALLGASFLSEFKGVDFVMTAMFLCLAIDSYRSTQDNICATLALVAAVFALVVAPHSLLLVALLILVILLVIRHFVERKKAENTLGDEHA
ncbi:MAG: AzlC family ABC transporter permease [Rothia sp. (in: high G+C Gram-positive bacteria)]|nr:AzlC family ABC transporter permease [Rothia sp. (in: high G+C Gram-positive bacteria)]